MYKRFRDYVEELLSLGYSCTSYSSNEVGDGVVYYKSSSNVLKITHSWVNLSENHLTAGYVLNVEDVTV